MEFLSEALVAGSPSAVSAFTECIIAATISGRVLSHRRQCEIEEIYSSSVEDLWTQHGWINALHNQWMQQLSSTHAVEIQQADPMPLFIALMFLVNILHMHETASLIGPSENNEQRDLLLESRKRAKSAAKQIVNLTKELSKLISFRVSYSRFDQNCATC